MFETTGFYDYEPSHFMGLYIRAVWYNYFRCFSFDFFIFFQALTNAFLENSFIGEALERRIYFLFYIGETKKSSSFNSLDKFIYKEALLNIPLSAYYSDTSVECITTKGH
jgi:hypothetical protein